MNRKLTSEWKLVDIANESQLEDYDRIRKKHKKVKQYAREAARDMDMSTYCESDINTLREAVSDLQEEKESSSKKYKNCMLSYKRLTGNLKRQRASRKLPHKGSNSDVYYEYSVHSQCAFYVWNKAQWVHT